MHSGQTLIFFFGKPEKLTLIIFFGKPEKLWIYNFVINFAILMERENGPRIFHVTDQDFILFATLAKLIRIIGEDKTCHYE